MWGRKHKREKVHKFDMQSPAPRDERWSWLISNATSAGVLPEEDLIHEKKEEIRRGQGNRQRTRHKGEAPSQAQQPGAQPDKHYYMREAQREPAARALCPARTDPSPSPLRGVVLCRSSGWAGLSNAWSPPDPYYARMTDNTAPKKKTTTIYVEWPDVMAATGELRTHRLN